MPRKTYTREFELQALRMLPDQGLPVAEVARRLGVTEGGLRTWKKAAEEHGPDAPRAPPPDPGRRRTPPPEGRGRPPRGRAGPAKKSRRVPRPPADLTFR